MKRYAQCHSTHKENWYLCTDEDTSYVYDTNCKLSQLLVKTTNGVTTKYVYGLGLIGEEVNNTFKTYHFDFRGSTIAITDMSGNITDTFAYDTYGKQIARTGTSDVTFGYNGRDGVVTDKNGFIYMRARYYSPEMRRFINADIIPGKLNNAVTLNRYAYANANPAMFIDPKGLVAILGLAFFGVVALGAGILLSGSSKREKSSSSSDLVSTSNSSNNSTTSTTKNKSSKKTYTPGEAEIAAMAGEDVPSSQIIERNNNGSVFSNEEPDYVSKDYYLKVEDELAGEKDLSPEEKFWQDVAKYDRKNADSKNVLESHYFSSYNGKFVIRPSFMGSEAFSFGIIVLGPDVDKNDHNKVKHEYGHTEQFDKMGVWNYIKDVGIPSVTAYLLDKNRDLPYDYYTAPWEAEADEVLGVLRSKEYLDEPWTEENGYYNLIDLFGALIN